MHPPHLKQCRILKICSYWYHACVRVYLEYARRFMRWCISSSSSGLLPFHDICMYHRPCSFLISKSIEASINCKFGYGSVTKSKCRHAHRNCIAHYMQTWNMNKETCRCLVCRLSIQNTPDRTLNQPL